VRRARREGSTSGRKRIRGSGVEAAAPAHPERTYKIGEAAKLVGVRAFVLRFWETQFSALRPKHSVSGHRYYQAKDLEAFKLIKDLLHRQRYTIEGARKYLKKVGIDGALNEAAAAARTNRPEKDQGLPALDDSIRARLSAIRRDLISLRTMLGP
jgi:DNA-binding transcriptional MerR regulator